MGKNARKKLRSRNKDKIKAVLTPFIAGIIFFVELIIKSYLRHNFAHQSLPLADGILRITVVFNTGTAFGLLRGETNLLIYASLILIILLLFIFKKERQKSLSFLTATGLIFGGALSNLFDRLTLQAVIDYIDLGFWPVFNIADTCISIGAIILIINSFKTRIRP